MWNRTENVPVVLAEYASTREKRASALPAFSVVRFRRPPDELFDDGDRKSIGECRSRTRPHSRGSSRGIGDSAGDIVVLNFRFRYNPSEGADLFLVLNESLNSDRYSLTPRPPLSQTRTILVKYARTFTLTF